MKMTGFRNKVEPIFKMMIFGICFALKIPLKALLHNFSCNLHHHNSTVKRCEIGKYVRVLSDFPSEFFANQTVFTNYMS